MPNSPKSPDWRQLVQRLLKAEMSKRGVKYQDLSNRLSSIGVNQSADNLRNKVNKGILGPRHRNPETITRQGQRRRVDDFCPSDLSIGS